MLKDLMSQPILTAHHFLCTVRHWGRPKARCSFSLCTQQPQGLKEEGRTKGGGAEEAALAH